jgi:hypothetical protein
MKDKNNPAAPINSPQQKLGNFHKPGRANWNLKYPAGTSTQNADDRARDRTSAPSVRNRVTDSP